MTMDYYQAEHIPDLKTSMNLLDVIDKYLPQASFYIAEAPVETYGLTPLHFAPKPESLCRKLFLQSQIDNHLDNLIEKQLPDGGWPINWDAPGAASSSVCFFKQSAKCRRLRSAV